MNPDDRVPRDRAREHYRQLRALGMTRAEIAENTGVPVTILTRFHEEKNRTIEYVHHRDLLAYTLDKAREYVHPTYVDEVVFERMQRQQPCQLHWRQRNLHIRVALARGYKYSQVMEYFRVSGATMKNAREMEMSNA